MGAGSIAQQALTAAVGGSGRLGLFIAVLVLAFAHFALRPVVDSWFVSPNLLVCGVLVAARQLRPAGAAAVGFFLGLLEDAMAVSHFGVATLLLVLLAYGGSRTRDFFLGEEPLFMGTYLFLGTFLYEAAVFVALGAAADPVSYLLVRTPLVALATGVVGYLTLPIVGSR